MKKTFVLSICVTLILSILINTSCTDPLSYLICIAIWQYVLCPWIADQVENNPNVDWDCNGDGNTNFPNDHDYDWNDDYDDDDPDIVLTCEGVELSSWVLVNNETDGYVWAEMSLDDETKFVSEATYLSAGLYPGINIYIPINWEQIETRPYDVNYYFCKNEADIYDKTKSVHRLTGIRKAYFNNEKINYCKSRENEFDFLYEKYDYDYCLTVNATIDFSITRHEGPPSSLEIIKGWNPLDSNIVWSKGGRRTYAAWLDTQSGRCSTIAEATAYDDLYIIATDTILGLVDTIGLYIDEPPYCTPNLQYVNYYGQLPDVDGIAATMKVKYGKLCGEELGDTTAALSCHWIGISKVNQGETIWAQCGTMLMRVSGHQNIDTSYYYEATISAGVGEFWHSSDVGIGFIPENEELRLECELVDSGIWAFNFNDSVRAYSDPFQIWLTPGNSLEWTSEIKQLENDMGGGQGDTLMFWDMQYRLRSTGTYVLKKYGDCQNNALFSSDPIQWKIIMDTIGIDMERIKIWDDRPLP